MFGATRPQLARFCIVPAAYEGQICSTGFCVLRPKKKQILPQWIYFQISLERFYEFVKARERGSNYPTISTADVKAYEIPVPALEEQERIVGILDKFDRLVNDLSEGLPAEIEARRAQYAHYREKLLSF